MHFFADVIVGLVAGLHLYFLILEMFLWTHPIGRRAFGLSPEFAAASKKLAANQGLYNGFLAVGLIWGLWAGTEGFSLKLFFLGCIIAAGIYGGLTTSRKILLVQALPGLLGWLLVWLSK